MLPYLGLGGTGTVFIFLTRLGRLLVGTTIVIAVTSVMGFNTLTTSPTSLVASHHQTPSNSTLVLVLVNSTDGVPHHGQVVTFNVSTTATSTPSVDLKCSQTGSMVLSWTAGFYSSYQWTKDVTLSSPAWTSGAASCTATLYYSTSNKTITLATLPFQVYA